MDQSIIDRITKNVTDKKHRPFLEIVTLETRKALASYYGGVALIDYIPEYSAFEDRDKLRERQLMTVNHYDNYPKEIANVYVESIYKSKEDYRKITGTGAAVDKLNEYYKTNYYNWLINDVVPFSFILGELYVYVEKPGSNSETAADDLELIPEPYAIFPQYVLDLCEYGDVIEWIAIACGPKFEDVKIIDREEIVYLVKGKEPSIVTDEDGNPTPNLHGYTDENGNPICPVVKIQFQANHYYGGAIGYATLYDVINKSIGNLQFISMFVEMVMRHLSLKLAMGEDTSQRTLDENSGIGNDTLILERGGPEYVPTRYVPLPQFEITALLDLINKYTPETIFRSARLRLSGTVSGASGISKLMDALPELNALARLTEYVWKYDEKICALIAQGYPGAKGKTVEVHYPAVLDVRTTAERMQDITSLVASLKDGMLPTSQTLNVEIMKQVYDAILPNLDADTRKKGHDELEAFITTGATPKTIVNQLSQSLGVASEMPEIQDGAPNALNPNMATGFIKPSIPASADVLPAVQ